MSFNYDELKSKENSESSFWASYSDLFMVLSLVFLLLYVVAGLRSGTSSMQQHMEHEQLIKENADYREQLKAYNTLKDDYLSAGATKSETKTYKKLMGKLSLLQEEAKTEKENLKKKSEENAEKEQALNQYQQIVRNIINTNMLSAARMKRKTRVIERIDGDLSKTQEEVEKLNSTIENKEQELANQKLKIENTNKDLASTLKNLERSYKAKKLTESMMKKKMARIKNKAKKKIESLEKETEKVESQLNNAVASLSQAENLIGSKEKTILNQTRKISGLESEVSKNSEKVEEMKQAFRVARSKAQKEFNERMKDVKMSARQRDKEIQKFRDELMLKKKDLDSKVAGLEGKLQEKENALAKTENKAENLKRFARGLASKNKWLSRDLKTAKAKIEAKKKIIEKISKNLRNAGLNASVDPNTGDVILSFGNEYFDTGKATLKQSMKVILRKFMPAYSKSLLSDPKTAEKIQSVELVGFASPTYRGKYVDPDSLKASDREAVSYNLDLSYYRAKSIFDYIFDTTKMKYPYQKEMVPLVKVVGRSFFAEGANRKIASQMTRKEYCRKYDCKKAQKVIVRFDLGN